MYTKAYSIILLFIANLIYPNTFQKDNEAHRLSSFKCALKLSESNSIIMYNVIKNAFLWNFWASNKILSMNLRSIRKILKLSITFFLVDKTSTFYMNLFIYKNTRDSLEEISMRSIWSRGKGIKQFGSFIQLLLYLKHKYIM